MSSKTVVFSLVPAAVLGASLAFAGRSSSAPGDDRPCSARESSALVCTLTGETLSECCCRPSPDGLVCAKTGEALSQCCCVGESGR